MVEGNIDYQYAHGESVARVKVKAGEHSFRASFPEFAGMANPRDNVNLGWPPQTVHRLHRYRGPVQSGGCTAREPEADFRLRQKTPECARKIIENLARRAYRRPVTKQEVDGLVNLAAMVRKDSGFVRRRHSRGAAGNADVAEFPVSAWRARSGQRCTIWLRGSPISCGAACRTKN